MESKNAIQRLLSWRPHQNSNGDHGSLGIVRSLSRPVPDHVSWSHLFGALTVFLLCVQGLTGVLLAIYYQPTLEGAQPSLIYLTTEVRFGWLIHSVHAWTADLLFIVIAAHLFRVILSRAYVAPRGLTWGLGVVLLIFILGFRFTGHMLPGDQNAYWSAVQESQIIADLPIVGNLIQAVLYGSVGVSSESLGRVYAIHALVLPWLTFLVLLGHIYLVRKYGFAPDPDDDSGVSKDEDRRASSVEDEEEDEEDEVEEEEEDEVEDEVEEKEEDGDEDGDGDGDGEEEEKDGDGDGDEKGEDEKSNGEVDK